MQPRQDTCVPRAGSRQNPAALSAWATGTRGGVQVLPGGWGPPHAPREGVAAGPGALQRPRPASPCPAALRREGSALRAGSMVAAWDTHERLSPAQRRLAAASLSNGNPKNWRNMFCQFPPALVFSPGEQGAQSCYGAVGRGGVRLI